MVVRLTELLAVKLINYSYGQPHKAEIPVL